MLKITLLLVLLSLSCSLDVHHCLYQNQFSLNFTLIDGTPQNTTIAMICHDNKNLVIRWKCIDTNIVSPYTKCNDPLYNADVVEIFIATLDSYPYKYFELQVSPNSLLFFSDITNAYGSCASIPGVYQDCANAQYQSQRIKNGWQAKLVLPLSVIGRGQPQTQFKINLFRVDVTPSLPTKYITWKPTLASPPCFHVPKVFQQIKLV